MATLWNSLRAEVMGTVDDFRQKGAIGALRDAALDVRDMATGAGSMLVEGVQGFVHEGEEEEPVVRSESVPTRGATVPLELANGDVVEATVVDIDGVSEPPRARVTYEGLEEPLLVNVLKPGADRPARNTVVETGQGLLDGLKQEFRDTVQDFREKGAIGAVKDAALDAVDMVGSTAKTAVNGAVSLAAPLIDLDDPAPASAAAAQHEAGVEGAAPAAEPAEASPGGLLDGIKKELRDTVQDFREKGAVGAVKDAALDAVDMVGSAGRTVVGGVGTAANTVVDAVGPAATSVVDQARSLASPLIDLDTPADSTTADGAAERSAAGNLLEGVKKEIRNTVQDFREKGAVGAVKDAAWDAADMVSSGAGAVVGGARSMVSPLLQSDSPASAEADSSAAVPAAAAVAAAAGGATAAAAATQAAASASSSSTAGGYPGPAAAAAAPSSLKVDGPTPAEKPADAPEPQMTPKAPTTPPAQFKVKQPEQAETGGQDAGSGAKPARKSLVSMRRDMFEKPKEQPKKDDEELLD